MMHYARSDTHFLLSIYDHLRNALLEQSRASPPTANGEDPTVGGEDPTAGGENPTIGGEKEAIDPQQAMREVLRRSADTALKLYEREGYDEETGKGSMGWLNPSKKWMPIVAREEQAGLVFKRLHALRDRIAREEDESP